MHNGDRKRPWRRFGGQRRGGGVVLAGRAGGGSWRAIIAMVVVTTMMMGACGGSASDTAAPGTASAETPTPRPTIAQVEPTPAASDVGANDESAADEPSSPEPDPGADESASNAGQGDDTGTAGNVGEVPQPVGPAANFEGIHVRSISTDGAYAYASTSLVWEEPADCDGPAIERLAVVGIEAAIAGAEPVGAGLVDVAHVEQMVIGPNNQVAFVLRCGPYSESRSWVQFADLGSTGQIASLGARLEFEPNGAPIVERWENADAVVISTYVRTDPSEEYADAVEFRTIDVADGNIIESEQFDINDDAPWGRSAELTANGVTYRVIDDPNGSLGCEGFGAAVTLELDDGSGQTRVALAQPEVAFSSVFELSATPSGYISWVSACEGYSTPWVGKLAADGTIVDAHYVDTYGYEFGFDEYPEFQAYRVTDDGFLVAAGSSFNSDSQASTPAFLRYDLASDPHFVNSATDLAISDTPLFEALAPGGSWVVGDTLGSEPACGATTLYGSVNGQLTRAFPAGVELDPIVAVAVAEPWTTDYVDGSSYTSRTVVVQTECPAEYDGRRVWFGNENDEVVWGLHLSRADFGEVADVLAVRDVFDEEGGYVRYSVVTVELLDGTIVDAELNPLPE